MFKGVADKGQEARRGSIRVLKGSYDAKRKERRFIKKNDVLKEVNKKAVEISEMSREVGGLRHKGKEINIQVVNHHQMLSDTKKDELIKQANNILEINNALKESMDTVCNLWTQSAKLKMR